MYLLVFRTADVTKGVPGWLSGAVLVVVGIVLAAQAPRRRRMPVLGSGRRLG